jgi:hypothetical protein
MDEFDALISGNQENQPEDEFNALVSKKHSIAGEIPKGLKAGVQQLRGMGYGIGALAGEATGIKPLTEWAKEGLTDVEAKTPKPAVGSFADIQGPGDVAKYLAYGISSNLPNMLLSLTGGGAGAVIAKGMVGSAAKKAIIDAAIKRGALTGAGAASFGMEAGSIASDQLTEAGKVEPGKAVAAAIPAAILDVIPEWYLAKRLGWLGKDLSGFAGKGLKDRAVYALKVAGQQFAMEAPTEAMQSALERSAVEGKSITNKEAWDEYINSFILGGATGGVIGGAGGIFAKKTNPVIDKITNDPIQQDINKQLEALPEENAAVQAPIKAMDNTAVDKVLQAEKPVSAQPEAVAPIETVEEKVVSQPAVTAAPVIEPTQEIPSVFKSMPLAELTRYAKTGVKGAQLELAARQKTETAAPAAVLTPEKVVEQLEKKPAEAGFRDFVKEKGINWEDLNKDNDLLLKLRGEYISGNKQVVTPPTVIPAKEEVQTEAPIETPTPVTTTKKPRNTAEVRAKIAADKAAKESIAIAKRKVDTINLRENLSITTDPESMDYILSDYVSRLHSGTPGGLQGYTKGGEQVFAGSGYPEWVGDLVKKYGSKKTAPVLTKTGKAPGIDADAIIATIKRGMAGEKLTPYQRSVWEDINRIADQEARGDYSAVLDEFAKVRKGEDYAAAREQFAAEQIDIGASTESRADIEAGYRESIKSEGYTPEEEAAVLEEVNNFFKEASKPKEIPKGNFETADLEGFSEKDTFNLVNPETEISPKLSEQATPRNADMFATEGAGTIETRAKEAEIKAAKKESVKLSMPFKEGEITNDITILRKELETKIGRTIGDGGITEILHIPQSPNVQSRRQANTGRSGRILSGENEKLYDNVSEEGRRNSREIQKIAGIFGKQIAWIKINDSNLSNNINGMVTDKLPNKIFINIASKEPYLFVLGHELIHKIQFEKPILYEDLKNYLIPQIEKTDKFKTFRAESEKNIGASEELKDSYVYEELISDFAGEQFINEKFWDDMAATNPTLFEKVVQIAKEIIMKAIKSLGINTDEISQSFFKDIDKSRKILADVMNKYAVTAKGEISSGTIKLSTGERSILGTLTSTFTKHPEDIPAAEYKRQVDFFRSQKDFSKLDFALSVPFRFSQKYPEWREMWRIHGIDRQEMRSDLRVQFIKEAAPFFEMNKNLKAKGYTKEQIKESESRIERVAFAGDALGVEFTDEQLQAGVVDEYNNTLKLNSDEIAIYKSIRKSLDNVRETLVNWLSEQTFRSYRKHKWYNMLLAAAGVDLNAENVQTLLGEKGLNSAALQRARKIQVDIKSMFDRIETGISEVPLEEAVQAGALYKKVADKMQAEFTNFHDYLEEITGIKDKNQLDKLSEEVFTAYLQTRPQLKIIKKLRNEIGKVVGYVPRYRESGEAKFKVFEQQLDDDGNIALDDEGVPIPDKEIFSKPINGTKGAQEAYREALKLYGKDGKLPDNYRTSYDTINASPEAAFQGVSDANVQKVFDDAMRAMEGKIGINTTYKDAAGNPVNVFDQLREAGYQAIANQFKARGAMRSSIHREQDLIKGYKETGLQSILLNYMSSMAGLMTKQNAAADAMELLSTVKNPSMFNALSKYNKEMLRNDSKADQVSGKTRSFMFGWFLGGLLKSAVINLTQNPIVGFSELAKYQRVHKLGGFGKADIAYANAMKDVLAGNLTPAEQKFIDDMVSKGIATNQYIHSIFENVTQNDIIKKHYAIMQFLAKPFSMSEVYNRKSAAIALYRTAYDMHLKEAMADSKLSKEDATAQAYQKTFDDARTFIDNVHYAYGKANRPLPIMTGDVIGAAASSLYTFKGFTHNFLARQAELLSQKDFRTVLHTLAYLAMFGGMAGLPFFKDLFEFIEKQFGYSPINAVRKSLRGVGGDTLEKFGISGLPAVLGANISGSIATGLPWPISANSPEDSIFGVWGGMAQKIGRTAQALGRGDLNRAITEGSPEFMRNPRVAARESEIGKTLFGTPGYATNPRGRAMLDENGKPITIGAKEAVLKTVGFNPTEYARAKEKNQTIIRQETWANEAKQEVSERYRIAVINKDPNAVRDMMKNVADVNKQIRSRGLQMLVPPLTVSRVVQNSREVRGKKLARETAYRQQL